MKFDELCPNCARKLTKRENTFYCIACDGEWTEKSLKLANERLNMRELKENEVKSLSCPSCGGNFLVSDLTDNDEFVTCTKCKKVFLTSDIYLSVCFFSIRSIKSFTQSIKREISFFETTVLKTTVKSSCVISITDGFW